MSTQERACWRAYSVLLRVVGRLAAGASGLCSVSVITHHCRPGSLCWSVGGGPSNSNTPNTGPTCLQCLRGSGPATVQKHLSSSQFFFCWGSGRIVGLVVFPEGLSALSRLPGAQATPDLHQRRRQLPARPQSKPLSAAVHAARLSACSAAALRFCPMWLMPL